MEVYVSPSPELAACRRMIAQVQDQVQQFYARLGVYLVYVPAGPTPGPLAPAQRLRVELLSDKEWLDKSFKAFEVAPPLRLRFLQVCRDKCAYAHVPLSVVHISFKRFEQAQLSADPKDDSLNRNWLANLLVHELGHLMGLYHAHEFANDPVPVRLPDKTPQFHEPEDRLQKDHGLRGVPAPPDPQLPGARQGLPAIPGGGLRSPALYRISEDRQQLPGAPPRWAKWPSGSRRAAPRPSTTTMTMRMIERERSAVG